jgi:hypothetical protein
MSKESRTISDLDDYSSYPNVGIKRSVIDSAKKQENEAFNDFKNKTTNELEWIEKNSGGITAYAAKIELGNRAKLSKRGVQMFILKLFMEGLIVAVRLLGIWLIYKAIVSIFSSEWLMFFIFSFICFLLNGILFPLHLKR